MRRWARWLFRWANGLLLLPVALAVLAPWLLRVSFWPAEAASLLLPWLMVVPAGFLLVWLLLDWRWALPNLALLVLAAPRWLSVYQLHSPPPPAPHEIRVMSVNAAALGYKPKRIEAFRDFVAQHRPDILVVQEAFLPRFTQNRDTVQRWLRAGGFRTAYFQPLRPGNSLGLVIFSRYRIDDRQVVWHEKATSANSIVYADLHLYEQRIRVVNAHLMSYVLRPQQRSVLDSLQNRKLKPRTALNAVRRMARTWTIQQQQLDALAAALDDYDGPVIVCGDMNNPAYGAIYRQLLALGPGHLQDSYYAAGQGWGSTYGKGVSAFRIDYVLASPHFEVRQHAVLHNPLSDHKALLVRLRFGFHAAAEAEAAGR